MKKIVVIYHRADFDGLFCREIARKFLGDTAEYIGWDYGDPTPAKELLDGTEQLFMLDISIPDLMDHPHLIWIDHHKSAIEKFSKEIKGYRIDGVAACRLAWQYFTAMASDDPVERWASMLPKKEDYVERRVSEPLAVRLAGEYDIWDKRDPRAELFQFGLRSQDLNGMWSLLLRGPKKLSVMEVEALIDVGHPLDLRPDGTSDVTEPFVKMLLEKGEALQYAQGKQNESIINEIGFDLEWEGLKFLACNHARFNSHLFDAGLRPEHDALFGFKWTGTQWAVSLYHAPGKEHHDLSQIAVKYGGGGHRGACGFRTKTLPFMEVSGVPNYECLLPFLETVAAYYPGKMRLLVGIEAEYEQARGGKSRELQEKEFSHKIHVDDQLFFGSSLAEAFETAKKKFEPVDPLRVEAAQRLRAQAAAIERGEMEIPAETEFATT